MGKFINETGKVYGDLTVIEKAGKQGHVITQLCHCTCGNDIITTGVNLRKGRKTHCGCKTDHGKIDFTNQKFGRLTALYPTDKRIGGNVIQHCKCDCGNECDVSTSSLKTLHTQSCGCLRREVAGSNVKKNLVGQKFGMLTVLEEVPERTSYQKILYKCQCECGNITNVATNHLLSGNTQSCGCSRMSHGEIKVRDILKENNIDFIQEYAPKVLDLSKTAKYDFYIPSLNTLIEYDGKQHFDKKGSNQNEPFELVQKRDEAKNEQALKHNFILIRIPYTQYDKLNIKDLMPDTSTFIYNK